MRMYRGCHAGPGPPRRRPAGFRRAGTGERAWAQQALGSSNPTCPPEIGPAASNTSALAPWHADAFAPLRLCAFAASQPRSLAASQPRAFRCCPRCRSAGRKARAGRRLAATNPVGLGPAPTPEAMRLGCPAGPSAPAPPPPRWGRGAALVPPAIQLPRAKPPRRHLPPPPAASVATNSASARLLPDVAPPPSALALWPSCPSQHLWPSANPPCGFFAAPGAAPARPGLPCPPSGPELLRPDEPGPRPSIWPSPPHPARGPNARGVPKRQLNCTRCAAKGGWRALGPEKMSSPGPAPAS